MKDELQAPLPMSNLIPNQTQSKPPVHYWRLSWQMKFDVSQELIRWKTHICFWFYIFLENMHCVDNWDLRKRQLHVSGTLIPKQYLVHIKETLASFTWGEAGEAALSLFCSCLHASYKPLHSHHCKAEEGTLILNYLISSITVLTFCLDRAISLLFPLAPFKIFFLTHPTK